MIIFLLLSGKRICFFQCWEIQIFFNILNPWVVPVSEYLSIPLLIFAITNNIAANILDQVSLWVLYKWNCWVMSIDYVHIHLYYIFPNCSPENLKQFMPLQQCIGTISFPASLPFPTFKFWHFQTFRFCLHDAGYLPVAFIRISMFTNELEELSMYLLPI